MINIQLICYFSVILLLRPYLYYFLGVLYTGQNILIHISEQRRKSLGADMANKQRAGAIF